MKQKNSFYCILASFFLFASCQSKKKPKEIKIVEAVPSNFKMYKTSEMADLMRTMLAKNNELRQQILNGEDIGDFNEAYLKIHTAKMTDASQRDATYPTFAKHFEQMQKDLFEVEESRRKAQFNRTVDACIACHQDRCAGPIPRIKKLYLK